MTLILVSAAFVVGRYTATPESVHKISETEASNVAKLDEEKAIEHEKTITETFGCDGRPVQKVTEIRTKKKSAATSVVLNKVQSKDETKIENRSGVSVSILAGVPLTDFAKGLVYGASVSRKLFGPITVGLWGFTDLKFGVSVGLQL